MPIQIGDQLPNATLIRMGDEGAEQVRLAPLLDGRKVALFGLPGAFTGTCSSAHMPSFIRTRTGFVEKGVDEVICVTVNDPFVLQAWDEATGARAGGVTLLGDPMSEFTKAIGMNFTAPVVGFVERCTRFSSLIDNGVVTHLNLEEGPGVCEMTAGETLLSQIT